MENLFCVCVCLLCCEMDGAIMIYAEYTIVSQYSIAVDKISRINFFHFRGISDSHVC